MIDFDVSAIAFRIIVHTTTSHRVKQRERGMHTTVS
jgi:hypothetical protein